MPGRGMRGGVHPNVPVDVRGCLRRPTRGPGGGEPCPRACKLFLSPTPTSRRRCRKSAQLSQGAVHAHLLRHTFAQVALTKGAERAMVQDMLGHRSDAMTRRYAGSVRQGTAAKRMPEFAPL